MKLKYNFTPAIVDKILSLIQNSFSDILNGQIQSYFATERFEDYTVTNFNSELFLSVVNKINVPFYSQFIQSQTFQQYKDTEIAKYCQLQGYDQVHIGTENAPRVHKRKLRGESFHELAAVLPDDIVEEAKRTIETTNQESV